jgi:dipeptidase E
MANLSVLAISSSRVGNSGYLEMAVPLIAEHLGTRPLNIAFIPFASADGDYLAYERRVSEPLTSLPYSVTAVLPGKARETLEQADAIMVAGGNSFKLLHDIYQLDLFEIINEKVNAGTPYVGWSAGANITGMSIGTTNDMPIIEPKTFKAFGFFPFQINPHYLNQTHQGFNGETRDQRLEEYIMVNPDRIIIGLPEGTAVKSSQGQISYMGPEPAVLFSRKGKNELMPGPFEI